MLKDAIMQIEKQWQMMVYVLRVSWQFHIPKIHKLQLFVMLHFLKK